jgi:hypothetical protein
LLSVYADKGRYEKLDIAAGRKPAGRPRVLLDELATAICESYSAPCPTDELYPQWPYRNACLRKSMQLWRAMYAAGWTQGVFGAAAKNAAHVIRGER